MKDKELKKLTRAQLLEIMLAQSQELDLLRSELEKTGKELDRKEERISGAESIAEASVALNSFSETAQAAADQYLWNVRRFCQEKAADAGKTAEWAAVLTAIENAETAGERASAPAANENTETAEKGVPENDGERNEKAEPSHASGSDKGAE